MTKSGPGGNEGKDRPAQSKNCSRNLESGTSFPSENRRLECLEHNDRSEERVKNETGEVAGVRSYRALWARVKALILF